MERPPVDEDGMDFWDSFVLGTIVCAIIFIVWWTIRG